MQRTTYIQSISIVAVTVVAAFVLLACRDKAPTSSPDPVPVPSPAEVVGDRPSGVLAALPVNSAAASTADQLNQVIIPARDLRDLTVRLRADVNDVPAVVNQSTPEYKVGDQERFWVHDLTTGTSREVTAELVHKTAVAYAWVEVGEVTDLNRLIEAVDRFSTQSYPAEVAFFGHEWNPGVDDDPRLHILHIRNTGVAGYYSSSDEYSRLANPFSNEKEMFYIDLNMLDSGNTRDYETVLSHEFQHMIHWHNDSNESTWINEGLSEFAQEVTGFGADTSFVGSFVAQPDTQLNSWNINSTDNANHYGASYLFIHYLNQRFGPGLLTALVAEEANGIDGVQLALDQQGHQLEFDTLFADWVVANYANQPTALGQDGVYGYTGLNFPKPVVEQRFDQLPTAAYDSTVNNYATDYLNLAVTGDTTIHFTGQTETAIAALSPASGRYAWWSNSADMSDSRLTRAFDLSGVAAGAPIKMQVAMWWNIEPTYDYGYVLASRDGKKWQALAGTHSDTDNPAGNSFGPGYTGQSDPDATGQARWVTEEFDLSAYAGEQIWLRFEHITDDAITSTGWFIDDLRIPALGYESDFENGVEDWQSEGWLLTDNQLPQHWLVQALEFDGKELVNVQRMMVDNGEAELTIPALGNGRQAVLAISALAPVTAQPAHYELQINAAGN